MKKRIITGSIMALIVLVFFLLRQVSLFFFDFFIAVLLVGSAYEMSMVFKKANHKNNSYLIIIFPVLCYIGLLTAMICGLSLLNTLMIILAIFVFILLIDLIINCNAKRKIENVNTDKIKTSSNSIEICDSGFKLACKRLKLSAFLFSYPTLMLIFLFFINHIESFISINNSGYVSVGLLFILMIFLTSMFTDTCAYFIGSALKGPKLCPKISPKKTISGAIGGLLGSVLISVILFIIFSANGALLTLFTENNINVIVFIVYAVFASIFNQAGDIFASFIKRKLVIKDFSNIFPGHGGFMDRLDGITFNTLFSFIFIIILFI